MVDASETAALATIAPHVLVSAHFQSQGDGPCRFKLLSLAGADALPGAAKEPVAKTTAEPAEVLSLLVSGTHLKLMAGYDHSYPHPEQARATLAGLDSDKNGHLTKSEVPASEEFPSWTFDQWDADGNGQVTASEIDAADERRLAGPIFRSSVSEPANPLFTALDASGDGRLSVRELRLVAQRLLQFDRNGDGQLDSSELPGSMSLSLIMSTPGIPRSVFGSPRAVAPVESKRSGPAWFIRTDRNGDGDVSEREFFGSPELFRKLDTNGDGLIEPSEAAAHTLTTAPENRH
jgi:hypothetical protein